MNIAVDRFVKNLNGIITGIHNAGGTLSEDDFSGFPTDLMQAILDERRGNSLFKGEPRKPCEVGKERNEITGNCRLKCTEGKERNLKGNCVNKPYNPRKVTTKQQDEDEDGVQPEKRISAVFVGYNLNSQDVRTTAESHGHVAAEDDESVPPRKHRHVARRSKGKPTKQRISTDETARFFKHELEVDVINEIIMCIESQFNGNKDLREAMGTHWPESRASNFDFHSRHRDRLNKIFDLINQLIQNKPRLTSNWQVGNAADGGATAPPPVVVPLTAASQVLAPPPLAAAPPPAKPFVRETKPHVPPKANPMPEKEITMVEDLQRTQAIKKEKQDANPKPWVTPSKIAWGDIPKPTVKRPPQAATKAAEAVEAVAAPPAEAVEAVAATAVAEEAPMLAPPPLAAAPRPPPPPPPPPRVPATAAATTAQVVASSPRTASGSRSRSVVVRAAAEMAARNAPQ